MTAVQKEIFINKAPAALAAYMDDARNWPQWFTGVQTAEPDSRYPQVGGTVKVTYKSVGATFNLTFTQEDYQQGKTAMSRMAGMMTGTMRFTLVPEGSGTKVVSLFDYEVPGGGLGKLADKLVIERMNTENLEKSLEKLKAVNES